MYDYTTYTPLGRRSLVAMVTPDQTPAPGSFRTELDGACLAAAYNLQLTISWTTQLMFMSDGRAAVQSAQVSSSQHRVSTSWLLFLCHSLLREMIYAKCPNAYIHI